MLSCSIYSGTHQLLVYVDDANLADENINIIKKSTEAPLDGRKEAVNAEKTKYNIHVSTPDYRTELFYKGR
jgi:hypothetical protein